VGGLAGAGDGAVARGCEDGGVVQTRGAATIAFAGGKSSIDIVGTAKDGAVERSVDARAVSSGVGLALTEVTSDGAAGTRRNASAATATPSASRPVSTPPATIA
jgi:hypothetical protein